MIKPSVGRVVLFQPGANDADLPHSPDQPLAAIVARVWSDVCVNLAVFDANGTPHSRTSVRLVQEDYEAAMEGESFARWMPYQKSQAAKTDELEQELVKRVAAIEAPLLKPAPEVPQSQSDPAQ